MKQKFVAPKLTTFGPLVSITKEFDEEALEFEAQVEEIGDDDFESAAVIEPELDDE